jgi:hypothetical protein
VLLHNPERNRKTKAGSTKIPASGLVGAVEAFKDFS